jgi:cell division protein FtsQ
MSDQPAPRAVAGDRPDTSQQAGGPGEGQPPGGPARLLGSRLHRRGWKAAFFVLAAAAIVVGAAWALLGSRFLVVRSIQVSGTGPHLTRAQVLGAAGVPLGRPLIRVSDGTVTRRVERLTWVESAQVSTSWPDTLVITVRARVPVFALAAGDGYDVMDRFGVTVRETAKRPAGLPLLVASAPGTLPGQLRGSPAVAAAATVLGELPDRIGRQVRSVTAVTATDVSVKLAGGTQIVWGDTSRAGQKATELSVLMRRHARLYDVSAPGTAVTKG